MTPQTDALAPSHRDGRGVVATWWYTFVSAVFFAFAVLFVWWWVAAAPDFAALPIVLYTVCASAWIVALTLVVRGYWRAGGMDAGPPSATVIASIAVGTVAAAGAGLAAASVALPLALVVVLLAVTAPAGLRGRITGGATVVLIVLAVVEAGARGDAGQWLVPLLFAAALPGSVVSMIWWWEIVRELDRSRATEARLAAAQERLRLADDVHDLQGHHLQVIALQLELADRLLTTDPDAALTQLRAAQRSVDDARAGTRALATQFRGVPLPDELANAADLLRAAGVATTLELDPAAASAPSEVLGAVVRESTTNILKHGGGRTARLMLRREPSRWWYRAENDAEDAPADPSRTGTGIRGMAGRIERAGGVLTVSHERGVFAMDAYVPAEGGGAT